VAAAVSAPGSTAQEQPDRASGGPHRSLVIAHRGASGYRPEHTLAGYELAARLGADYVEPDLVPTRDGVLVCRHEPEISGTTDVAAHPEFATRRRTALLGAARLTGWFVEDFTLAELKTLRAVERLPAVRQRNTMYDGLFEVPTFQEVLDLRERLSAELGREIGICPETKRPAYFRALGLPLEARLLDILDSGGLNRPDAPVIVQSLEVTNLKYLRTLGLRTQSLQLLKASGAPLDTVADGSGPTYAELASPSGLAGVSSYAQGIGPDKALVVPLSADGSLGAPTSLVADAHAAGLVVHPFTFRAENHFQAVMYRRGSLKGDYGRALDEQMLFLQTGIDGLFTDQPDVGVLARAKAFALA
jgi:glycerophosphoryl diester phosphodiesterase